MADSKAHKPGGLLDQYNLLGAIIDASWATRLDHKVARHIIDRYYPKHDNGRASLRYLERATGASRPNVIASVRRLAEQGAIVLVRQGQGTRPSEFSLNFEFPSSGIADDTTSTSEPSGTAGDTSGGIAHDTANASSGIADDTESYLLSPAYKPADSKVANAVSASGPDAEAPAVAGEEFDRVWHAYGKLGNKRASRRAFETIDNPDTDHIANRAAAWAASAKPGRRRMPLEKWLAEQKYDEADRVVAPTSHEESDEMAKRQTKSEKAEAAAVNARLAAEYDRNISRATVRLEATSGVPLTVTGHAMQTDKDGTWLRLTTTGGSVAVLIEGAKPEHQDAGQAHLGRLASACGIPSVEDGSEFHGRAFMIVDESFAAADDMQEAA